MKLNCRATSLYVTLLVGIAFSSESALYSQQIMPIGHHADQPSTAAVNASKSGVAVKGYDLVSYFEDKKPTKGDPKISTQHNGITYLFASEMHRDAFTENPDRYLPQYGGYCAFGASKGHKAEIDPEAWAIVDDKLYLNSSKGAQTLFDKDRQGAIKQADTSWVKLK